MTVIRAQNPRNVLLHPRIRGIEAYARILECTWFAGLPSSERSRKHPPDPPCFMKRLLQEIIGIKRVRKFVRFQNALECTTECTRMHQRV